jgi:hypothetical protein
MLVKLAAYFVSVIDLLIQSVNQKLKLISILCVTAPDWDYMYDTWAIE